MYVIQYVIHVSNTNNKQYHSRWCQQAGDIYSLSISTVVSVAPCNLQGGQPSTTVKNYSHYLSLRTRVFHSGFAIKRAWCDAIDPSRSSRQGLNGARPQLGSHDKRTICVRLSPIEQPRTESMDT